jgi:serine protease Do
MRTSSQPTSKIRSRLMAAVASLAIAGAIGLGAVTTGTAPVFAEAVNVQGAAVPGFADVVQQVSPAVVSVRVKSRIEPASDDGAQMFGDRDWQDLPDGHPLKRFFREFRGDGGGQLRPFDRRGDNRRFGRHDRERPTSQGSGFFISEDGYVVTNNHVVENGSTFTIVTDDGRELDAKLIGADPRTDLALLKVEESGKFTYVDFADDAKVRVGDWVVAVGNPFGLGGTVTAGIVSARGRDIGAGPYDDFIQIDAAVNRGNSGGPAFNLNGQVVGINTAIFSPGGGGNVGIAFAIPASTAKEVIGDLMKDGTVERGWLGVQIQPVTPEIADSLGLTPAKGALVSEAQADGPALKAGIKAGDVITSVDGKDVANPKELARLIAGIDPGKGIDVVVWRGGKSETVKVDLGELPGSDKQAAIEQPGAVEPGTLEDLGLTVTRAEDGKGIVVTDVDPDSEAADRGIQAGDVITSINSLAVNDTGDVDKAMADASKAGRKSVLVQVERDDNTRFVALPLAKG